MRCIQCSSDEVVSIGLSPTVDSPVTFFTCHICEKRWWQQQGQFVSLSDVLTRFGSLSKKVRATASDDPSRGLSLHPAGSALSQHV